MPGWSVAKVIRCRLFYGLLLLLFLGLTGCLSISSNTPPGAYYDAYRPINDPESVSFVSNGLAQAVAEFGEPAIPVNKVLLRRSRKTREMARYRIPENFSLTQCVDPTNGVFVIYVEVDYDHINYFAYLGHECAHLINAKIADWYMEGIATVFSEEYCAKTGKKWGDWKRHFMRSRRLPYALSYRMMLELKAAFPEDYPRLIQHLAITEKAPEWRHLDIDAWMETLPESRQDEALDIIEPYAKSLKKSVSRHYDFAIPKALQ